MPFYHPKYHHRRSIRLKGYDYSQQGLYFITIVCQDRACLFGHVENGIMELNDAGQIAQQCWQAIPDHFPNVVLHEYVIMPNHVHGILEITAAVGAKNLSPITPIIPDVDGAKNFSPKLLLPEIPVFPEIPMLPDVERAKNFSPKLLLPEIPVLPEIPMLPDVERAKNLSPLPSMVRGFKIGVTKWMRQNTDIYHVWQRNYYEHIIRNELSYYRISNYILNNPGNWKGDTCFRC